MTIGGGITLAALGAILLFAVEYQLAGIDINVIGLILLVAGIAGVIFGLVSSRRRVVATERPVAERPARERVVERDRDAL